MTTKNQAVITVTLEELDTGYYQNTTLVHCNDALTNHLAHQLAAMIAKQSKTVIYDEMSILRKKAEEKRHVKH